MRGGEKGQEQNFKISWKNRRAGGGVVYRSRITGQSVVSEAKEGESVEKEGWSDATDRSSK